MKINQLLFASITATTLLAACATSDSETLKRARSIQEETSKEITSLDSSLSAQLKVINDEMSKLSTDTTLAVDSVKIKSYEGLKAKQESIVTIKDEMMAWQKTLPQLPTSDEIAAGAANPFGEKAKDQDVLAAIKKGQDDLSSWKAKVEAATK